MIQRIVWFLVGSVFLVACQSCDQDKQRQREVSRQLEPKQLIKTNKEKIDRENKQIEGYVKRRGWEMEKSGTGLRYMVYDKGEGEKGKTGQQVTIEYDVYLIHGEKVYSSEKGGPFTFEIGKANVESGLHEAMTYLRKGDKAHLVIPSYLAHGLTGDRNKIPGDATVIYDVQVLDLE